MSEDIEFMHEPDRHRFTAVRASDGERVGEAHYRLLGDDGIDFDHTLVPTALRGQGIASRLVHAAVTSDLARERRIAASCPFVATYLREHPDLA
ncbi:hypothetical protein K8P10_001271 [Leucobacter sp. Psy1]|uniref:GNAT family N-acetyltransferase n=1 Tax=Leucobacter sp. Psy1 TaxID=2875729 RepID=UPI001CD60364|nr:GNAT family N-acetyltransferase [Leucobacter sp. Psy1]UBH05760.1 hypothetical protein K8P10_001271 [Leucobacter sp. Psy1]